MCIKNKKCCAWISLESIGISPAPKGGCLRNNIWIHSLAISCSQPILDQLQYIKSPTESLRCINNVAHGTFGYIDSAVYKKENRSIEVYVKRPIIPGRSLLYEACIQKLVGDHLRSIGFPTGAARILSIFKLRDNSVCFAMEQIDNAMTLDKYLESTNINTISSVIIDCLLQLCAMIWYLDTTMGINHRDLKPSNFLIVEHEPITKMLQIEHDIFEIKSKYSLTFIDFGFSCLGSTETHISDISLSTVYSKFDPCPKEGRDMYLFLSLLYVDFHSKLPAKLLKLFDLWINTPSSNMTSFMRKDKESSKEWVYYIAGDIRIKKFNSSPSRIVTDLKALI
jgi:serine/threonine protein kinase